MTTELKTLVPKVPFVRLAMDFLGLECARAFWISSEEYYLPVLDTERIVKAACF